MGRRSATAPLSLGRTTPPEPPATADRTTRQILGYLLFLANWANAVGLVPRRLAGTNRFRFHGRPMPPEPPARFPGTFFFSPTGQTSLG